MSPGNFPGEFEQLVLLAVLQRGETAFALEVRREIERSADRSVSRGAFYTTLERFEAKGWVRWTEEPHPDPGRGGELRRFEVTPEGLDALRTSRAAVRRLSRGLDGLLEAP